MSRYGVFKNFIISLFINSGCSTTTVCAAPGTIKSWALEVSYLIITQIFHGRQFYADNTKNPYWQLKLQ